MTDWHMPRPLPAIPRRDAPRKPISFVVVRYSGDFEHNLARSECVHDPLNELVVVDNRGNLCWPTLSSALVHGIAQARHELVVLVHEDVLLPAGWQAQFEWALAQLESVDPDWCILGVAGWDEHGKANGHWSDPRGYKNLLGGKLFAEVDRVDEHLMVVRRQDHALDPMLPSIHNIGRDLARSGRASGRRTYVIDAPTIHKFADAEGQPILDADDSPKIRGRSSLTYLADRSLSDDYLREKWAAQAPDAEPSADPEADRTLDAPLVLVSRGGGGSRLLSHLAQHAGIHLGNELGAAGDSLALVDAIYRAVLGKYRYPFHTSARAAREIRSSGRLIRDERPGAPWGFKLPEAMLVLEEIRTAFPAARFVHLVRDPLTSCLRRTHMTARMDNQIGQAVVRAAYQHLGIPVTRALSDPDEIRMAVSTIFHFDMAQPSLDALPPSRLLTLRFEDLLSKPHAVMRRFMAWKERHGPIQRMMDRIRAGRAGPPHVHALLAPDPERASKPLQRYSSVEVARVADLLATLRHRIGYRDGAG